MMFMGVVSASSINGDFEGSPVVTLFNNGWNVPIDDVPAIIYKNRTMVPIYLLKKMGATVTWDLDKYSVDIQFPKSVETVKETPPPISNSDIINNAKLANMFKLTQDLADRLRDYSSYISLYFSGYNSNNPNAIPDNDLINYFSSIIDNYNLISDKFNSIKTELTSLDLSSLRSAIQSDYDSIDQYKLANTDIMTWKNYYVSNQFAKDQQYFDSYLKENTAGNKLANQAYSTSSSGYNTYILKIIN
ncbi:MAG: hypothetical protein JWM44_2658 [Bacilli bacterium]|nr:hypothetical protein [Bacilli bacterium]